MTATATPAGGSPRRADAAMRYRRLGDSDLRVSELALGSWLTYGAGVGRDAAGDCIRRAFELGINTIDTANMYGGGAAESLLGELLSHYRREDYLLATKVYFPMSATDYGLSRAQIEKQIDLSLARLRTDYVDIYYCHRYDDDTPLEETMQAMTDVVRAGKARYVGFSRFSPKQIRAAERLPGVERFACSQSKYSLLDRRAERRVFPLCRKLGIGRFAYSPLAQGVLSGKYRPGADPPAGSRAADRTLARKSRRFRDRQVLSAVQSLAPIAADLSLTLPQLALAWVLKDDNVQSALIGASRPEQVEENVGAVGVTLDADTLARIDRALGDVVRR